jgi:hypothetical protein
VVEFPREEDRGPAKDVVVLLEPPDLGFQVPDLGQFLARGAPALATVDLRLQIPAADRLGPHAVALGDRLRCGSRVRILRAASSICWTQRSLTFESIFFGTRPSSWTQKETASNLGRFKACPGPFMPELESRGVVQRDVVMEAS